MTSDVQILQTILRSIKQYYDPQKNLVSVRPGDPIFNEPAGGEPSPPLPGPKPTFISQAPEEELGFLDKALMRLYGQDENEYREGLALAKLKGERQKEELKGLEGKDVIGGYDPTGYDSTVSGPTGVAEQLLGQLNKGVELATAFGGGVGTQVKFGSGAKPTTQLGGSASAHATQEMMRGAAPAGRPRPGLGFKTEGEQRGFAAEKYPVSQAVKVTFPDGTVHYGGNFLSPLLFLKATILLHH